MQAARGRLRNVAIQPLPPLTCRPPNYVRYASLSYTAHETYSTSDYADRFPHLTYARIHGQHLTFTCLHVPTIRNEKTRIARL